MDPRAEAVQKAQTARSWAGRWVPRLYLLLAAALIPWTIYLAATLPRRAVAYHYRLLWVGYDVALIVVLGRIGWFAARRDPRVVLTAAAGAVMLAVDAWFDVMTSSTGRTEALLDAVLLEIPGSLLCALLARRGLAALVDRARHPEAYTTRPRPIPWRVRRRF